MKLKKLLALLLCACVCAGCLGLFAGANALGDVDGDGQCTAGDARMCLRQAVGLENYEPGSEAFAACDATGDGSVTAEDARLILRAAVGLEELGETQQPDSPAANEYDILRGGVFYCTGSMKDDTGSEPMEMAVTEDSIYMETEISGVKLALLQKNGRFYMIYPEKKIYLEIDKAVQKLVGIEDGMLNVEELGFSEMQPLSEANTVADGELNGAPCQIYTFLESGGARFVIYMDGEKLLAFENIEPSGSRTTTYITSITADVPADKCNPPAGYRKVGFLTFMTALEDAIL